MQNPDVNAAADNGWKNTVLKALHSTPGENYTAPTNPDPTTSHGWASQYIVSQMWNHTRSTETALTAHFGNGQRIFDESDDLRMAEAYEEDITRSRPLQIGSHHAAVKTHMEKILLDPIRAAFSTHPMLGFSEEKRPAWLDDHVPTVDRCIMFRSQSMEEPDCVAIGVVKGYRTIDRFCWSSEHYESTSREFKLLAAELRGWAEMYRCPQVFCFDGEHLLMIRFNAEKGAHQLRTCGMRTWLFNTLDHWNETYSHARLALYCLVREGVHRILAEHGGPVGPNRGRNGWRLNYEWCTGRRLWTNPQDPDHEAMRFPEGFSKEWNGDEQRWVIKDARGLVFGREEPQKHHQFTRY